MPWKIKLYIGSLEEAYECASHLELLQSTPVPEPLWAYTFTGNTPLVAFALDFGAECLVEDKTMLIPDSRKDGAEASIQHLELSSSVQVTEMFAIEVWGEQDEAVFDALFD